MKDNMMKLTTARQLLVRQLPGFDAILPGSLLSRMVRCNKPGCQFCQKKTGKGHGPIWILSISLGNRRVRQVPIPVEMKKDVEAGLRSYAQMQTVLKQIAETNVEILKERKLRR